MNNLSLCLKVFSSKERKSRLSLSSAVSSETILRMLSPCKICSIYWCKVPKIPFELPSPCSCSILVISFPFSWSNVRFIGCWLSKELTFNLIDFYYYILSFQLTDPSSLESSLILNFLLFLFTQLLFLEVHHS